MEYFVVLTFGVLTRILLGFTNYTQSLGVELSDTKDGIGYQNAITPPAFSVIAIIIYGLSLLSICFGFMVSFTTGLIYLGIYLASLIIVGAVFFKPGVLSPFAKPFYNIVLNSIINRHADYKNNNDTVRAEAMGILLERFKKAYK